jgi:cytochrome c
MMKKIILATVLAGLTSLAASDGASLFKKCVGCHGSHAEKSALGKSQIIAGWEASKIENALHGYKDESYGGVMKPLMKGQVAALSDSDIKALAEYIHGL